mgnify:CR=1 FL=1
MFFHEHDHLISETRMSYFTVSCKMGVRALVGKRIGVWFLEMCPREMTLPCWTSSLLDRTPPTFGLTVRYAGSEDEIDRELLR